MNFLPACPLHALTGLFCPFCGSTRAAAELLHGHMGAALRLNVLSVGAIPMVALWTVFGIYQADQTDRRSWVQRRSWVILVVLLFFGIARNLPWWPFSFLAPH